MIQMQRVQPEIKKIQQKYKDDKAKQNEELLKFYQENKINPLAGCLPLLVTIPIGIAVFRTFSQGVQTHLPQTGHAQRALRTTSAAPQHDTAHALRTCKAIAEAHPRGAALPRHEPQPLRARRRSSAASPTALPYFVLIALVMFTGWYQVRQTQARQSRAATRRPTRRCRRSRRSCRSSSGSSPSASMPARRSTSSSRTPGASASSTSCSTRCTRRRIAAGDQAEADESRTGASRRTRTAKDPPANGKAKPAAEGLRAAAGQEPADREAPTDAGGSANGDARAKGRQGTSSGARRKKRKR